MASPVNDCMENANQIKSEIADRILTLLDAKGVSQAELARRIGSARSYVTRIVQGNANLTLETVSAIEQALESPILKVVKRG